MNYIEAIDNKYADNEVACNLRTANEIGKNYKGMRVAIDIAVGDFIVACNKRTYGSLQGFTKGTKEALQPVIIEQPKKDTPKVEQPKIKKEKKGKK